jgi:hypothetical protein
MAKSAAMGGAKKAAKGTSKVKQRAAKALYEFLHAADTTAKPWKELPKELRMHYRKAAMVVARSFGKPRKTGAKKRRVKL